jgi:hypothetical protein
VLSTSYKIVEENHYIYNINKDISIFISHHNTNKYIAIFSLYQFITVIFEPTMGTLPIPKVFWPYFGPVPSKILDIHWMSVGDQE